MSFVIAGMLVAGLVAAAPAESVPAPMEQNQEIALALSACPKDVGAKATVYVLRKTGYAKVREGQNGFTALVDHLIPKAVEPRCMDAEGTRTLLPVILKRAELRVQGKSREEIKRAINEGFAKGAFRAPVRPGVDYMLSTQNVVTVDEERGIAAPFPPHLMFYAPYMTNADIGSSGKPDSAAFVVEEGTPHALIIVPAAGHGAGHAPPSGGK